MKRFRIGSRPIGEGAPCLVIAEIGVNHNGSVELAKEIVHAAAESGAEAVKFQAFIPEHLVTESAAKARYQVRTMGIEGTQLEMLKRLQLGAEQHRELKGYCEMLGLLYLCTPYEEESADMLETLGVPAYKVASTDVTNVPLLRHLAGKGRPILLSTGMSTLGEVELAVGALRDGGDPDVVILQCTSEYPTPMNDVNLRAIETLRSAFGLPVGFSDHTAGVGAAPWAVVLGAVVVEKHFTTDRSLPGPDQAASLEPGELAELVHAVRAVEAAMGDGRKLLMPSERENKPLMQKSLVARRRIAAGDRFTAELLAARRPAVGLAPAYFDRILGLRASRDIEEGSIITSDSVAWEEGSDG